VTLTGNTVLSGDTVGLSGGVSGGGNDLTLNSMVSIVGNTLNGGTASGIGQFTGGSADVEGSTNFADSFTFNGGTFLSGNWTVTAGGDITFNNTVNGAADLSLNAATGTVTIGGSIGGGTALDTFIINADAAIMNAGVTAASAIGTVETLTTAGSASLTGTNNEINTQNVGFGGVNSLISTQGTLLATGADDTFVLIGANQGSTAGINFSGIITIDAGGGVDELQTDTETFLTGVSNQAMTHGVTVSNFQNLVSTNGSLTGSGSNETFTHNADGSGIVSGISYSGINVINGGAGNDVLNLSADQSDGFTFIGGSGNNVANILAPINLPHLSIDAQEITISGNVTTSGTQNYTGDITLMANTILTGSEVTFGSTLNGSGNDLTINSTGSLNLGNGEITGIGNFSTTGVELNLDGTFSATSVSVGLDSTLVGNGVIGSDVTIQAGGTLAPGNSIGSIAVDTLAFESGAIFAIKFDSSSGAADLVTLNSTNLFTLFISGGVQLDIMDLDNITSMSVGTRLVLIDYSASTGTGWDGGFFTLAGTSEELEDGQSFFAEGYEFVIRYNDVDSVTHDGNFVTLTVIPEPSSALLAALGALALFRRHRKS